MKHCRPCSLGVQWVIADAGWTTERTGWVG
jgi:hypothetical protein